MEAWGSTTVVLTFNSKELDHYDAKAEALFCPAFYIHFSRNEVSCDVKWIG